MKLCLRTCCSLRTQTTNQIFSNNCLKAHSINSIFYGDGEGLYKCSILRNYLKTKSGLGLMSFEDLEIGICAHQETTQNISIGFHRRY